MTALDQQAAAEEARGGRLGLVRLALIALLLGAFGTSLSGVFIKLSELPPTATGFYRLFLSAPLLWLWLIWERPRQSDYHAPKGWRDYLELSLAAVFFGVNTAVWCWCMMYTTVANGQLIVSISPILVALVAFLFLGERMSLKFLAGLALTLGGVVLLMSQSSKLGSGRLLGDGLAAFCALFWSLYLVSVQHLRRRFSTAVITTWTAFGSAVVLLLGAAAAGETLLPTTLFGWTMVLGLAFLSQVAGQSLITYGMRHLPVSFTAVALLIQPFYAGLVAWIVLGETPTPLQAVGGAVILSGIVMAKPRAR